MNGNHEQQTSLVREPQSTIGPGNSISGLLPLVAPLPGPSWIDNVIKPEIYVANLGTNSVDIYSAAGRSTGHITGFNSPEGLAVDSKGNLYVADTGNQTISVFAPGTTTPLRTLNDPGFFPVGVVTDASGNVYVANICAGAAGTLSCTGDGSVLKYLAGQTTFHTAYKNTSILRPYFLAFDEKPGVLWADGFTTQNNGTPIVGSWTRASTFTASTIAINFPGAMQTDKNDNLAVDDQLGPTTSCCKSTLYVFPNGTPPASNSFVLSPATGSTACDVVSFALLASNGDLWTGCELFTTNPATPGFSQKLPYPAGGAAIKTIASGTFVGAIATAPVSGN
jgi:hypothetical protein